MISASDVFEGEEEEEFVPSLFSYPNFEGKPVYYCTDMEQDLWRNHGISLFKIISMIRGTKISLSFSDDRRYMILGSDDSRDHYTIERFSP
jgi:hypothetical protein